MGDPAIIGLISDTHGLMRPEALAALKGSELIIHAGDVGKAEILDELREIARDIPADRLLVETDAPYLAPVPFRGKRNEPAFVAHTAKTLAEVRGLESEALADLTTANFRRLFRKTA